MALRNSTGFNVNSRRTSSGNLSAADSTPSTGSAVQPDAVGAVPGPVVPVVADQSNLQFNNQNHPPPQAEPTIPPTLEMSSDMAQIIDNANPGHEPEPVPVPPLAHGDNNNNNNNNNNPNDLQPSPPAAGVQGPPLNGAAENTVPGALGQAGPAPQHVPAAPHNPVVPPDLESYPLPPLPAVPAQPGVPQMPAQPAVPPEHQHNASPQQPTASQHPSALPQSLPAHGAQSLPAHGPQAPVHTTVPDTSRDREIALQTQIQFAVQALKVFKGVEDALKELLDKYPDKGGEIKKAHRAWSDQCLALAMQLREYEKAYTREFGHRADPLKGSVDDLATLGQGGHRAPRVKSRPRRNVPRREPVKSHSTQQAPVKRTKYPDGNHGLKARYLANADSDDEDKVLQNNLDLPLVHSRERKSRRRAPRPNRNFDHSVLVIPTKEPVVKPRRAKKSRHSDVANSQDS